MYIHGEGFQMLCALQAARTDDLRREAERERLISEFRRSRRAAEGASDMKVGRSARRHRRIVRRIVTALRLAT